MSCSSGFSWSYFYLFPFSCCLSCFILGAFVPWATIIIFQWFRKEKKNHSIDLYTHIHTHTHTHIHTPTPPLWKPWTSSVCVWIQFYLSHASFQIQETFNSRFPASGFRPLTSKVKCIFYCCRPASCWVEWREEKKKKEREKKWNRNVALPLQLATLYKEIKISLAPI